MRDVGDVVRGVLVQHSCAADIVFGRCVEDCEGAFARAVSRGSCGAGRWHNAGMRVPLILLPGMDGTGRLFASLVSQLAPTIEGRVVAYPRDQVLGYDDLLAQVREAAPRTGRWFVLGESFSGPLALRLAAEKPAGLGGVILAASFVTAPLRVPRWLHGLARPGMFLAGMHGLAGRVLGTGDGEAGLHAAFVAANAAVAPAVLARRAREILAVDLTQVAMCVDVPVLALAARRDRVVGAREVAEIQRMLPRATVAWLDAPHLVLQTRAAEAAAAIARFVAR